MADLRHDNHGDMLVLSTMVQLVPAHRQIALAAALLGRGLMRGPWWLRGLVWCVGSARGWEMTTTWYLFLSRFERGMPEQVIAEFARHIRHGKDASDTWSIGGLNQQEVNDTLQFLRGCLRGVDLHPTYRGVLDASASTASGGDHG